MSAIDHFPVTRRWPPRHPDRLQLYSLNTPNGVKVSILLEELAEAGAALPYEAHLVDFARGDQRTPEFTSLNPNARIPAIIDPDGPGGEPLALFESNAILVYLAGKRGRFLPADPARRWETLQWLFFQGAGVGPIFGQVGWFHKFDGTAIEDPRPKARYVGESRRVLGVLEQRLQGHEWIMGDAYTIADIAMLGPVRNLVTYYGARDLVGFDDFPHVDAWLRRWLQRPAVQRGLLIPSRDAA
jgi:GST-like protein